MNRTPAARADNETSAPIAAICRQSDSAWQAVCALLEYAHSQGESESLKDSEEFLHQHATAVSSAIEKHLEPRDILGFQEDSAFSSKKVAGVLATIPSDDVLLSARGFAHATATALDHLYWTSFAGDWLAQRGTSFELEAGDLYPVGEMRLMGPVGHSARPHRLPLRSGETAHVRRRAADGFRVRVVGEYASIIDRLIASTPLNLAVALPNESADELSFPPNRMGPAKPEDQLSTINRLLGDC